MRLSKSHKEKISEAILNPYLTEMNKAYSTLSDVAYDEIIKNTPDELSRLIYDDNLSKHIRISACVWISQSSLVRIGYRYDEVESFRISFKDGLRTLENGREAALLDSKKFAEALRTYVRAKEKYRDIEIGLSCALSSIKTVKALENEFPEAFKEFEKIKNSQPKEKKNTSNCDKIEQIRAELNSKI